METLITLLRMLRHFGPWLVLVLTSISLRAQSLFVNDALVTITTGTEVHLSGDLITHAAAELRNNGTIHLDRDLFHNGTGNCFGNSQGTVVLNGNWQTIGGSGTPVFNNLLLAGTGDKSLNNHIEVGGAMATPSGVLHLNDRRLHLSSHSVTVRNPSPLAIQRTTGQLISETDPTIGYGTVRWNIGQATTGSAYVIPFGNELTGHDLPFMVTVTDPGEGPTGWLSMATYPTDPMPWPNNRPLPDGLTELMSMTGPENAPFTLDRWWVMETGGYTQPPMADLSFTYRDSEWNSGTNMMTEDGLMLQDHRDGQWHFPPSLVIPTEDRLITTNAILRNSIWTASSMGSPLPVTLLRFEGERRDRQTVGLDWSTASEQNSDGFEVWRMIEGEVDFTKRGWVDAVGFSTSPKHYTWTDDNPTDQVSYYMLKQVDLDGGQQPSPVVAVQGMALPGGFRLYPNPANDAVLVDLPSAVEGALHVFDGSGRSVITQLVTGLSSVERIHVSHLAPGAYMLRFQPGDGSMDSFARLVVSR